MDKKGDNEIKEVGGDNAEEYGNDYSAYYTIKTEVVESTAVITL